MLDKRSKKVLKAVNKCIDELNNTSCPVALTKYLPQYDADTIEKSLWYLGDKGYLNCFGADNTIYDIEITYEGQNYFEFKRLACIDFFKKSILTPIAVSTFTTLLVNYLANNL